MNDNFTPEFMAHFCEETFRIAEKKIRQGEEFLRENPPARPLLPRLATGGSFAGLFLWDTAFCTMWAKYAPERFPVTTSLDNFYNLQEEDGFICREFQGDGKPYWSRVHPISFNPPILSWAEWQLFESGITDKARLEKVYPSLKKHYDFCQRTYRREDGLYFGDAMGCGMDDLPRMPHGITEDHSGIDMKYEYVIADEKLAWNSLNGKNLYCWNLQMGWIDISSQMALNALCLSRIAETIGETADAEKRKADHAELAEIINSKCWDEEAGFYFDYYNGSVIKRYHAGAFWTLAAGIIPEERVDKVVKVLMDPAIFNRTLPFATLGACEEGYDPENSYWRGSVWAPTSYVALTGLKMLGRLDEAKVLAKKYYHAVAELFRKTGTVYENMSPEQYDHPKQHSQPDFCGFAALTPIAVYHEFLKG